MFQVIDTLASVDQKDGHTVKSAITDDAYLIIPKHYNKYPKRFGNEVEIRMSYLYLKPWNPEELK
jgi:hypothetical protein